MKYQVPQFIETEDKIFGPLTIKQFIYVAGGVATGFIVWTIIPIKFIAIIIAAPIVIFFMALAFYRYNERPFIVTVENSIKYFIGDKLYIWRKQKNKIVEKKEEEKPDATTNLLDIPKLSDSKLKYLSWSLDINEKSEN